MLLSVVIKIATCHISCLNDFSSVTRLGKKSFEIIMGISILSSVFLLLVKVLLIESGSGFAGIVQVQENDSLELDTMKTGKPWDGSFFACRASHQESGIICDWIFQSRDQSNRLCKEKRFEILYSAQNLFCRLKINNVSFSGEPLNFFLINDCCLF